MNRLLENIFMSRELYQTILNPVCVKYGITHTEATVLLFLANNPHCDTARDIVERRRITKSAVSAATRDLQERGLIKGKYTNGNHRSIHLTICDSAKEIVEEGNKAQNDFFSVLTEGFTENEKTEFRRYFERVTENISEYNRSCSASQKRAGWQSY
ncbi:MAG: helix-turn-helix domain-containing protein [Bacillota bacterium]|nr:helix-turn-helix domain-containing protein [Bacillota bacterium]